MAWMNMNMKAANALPSSTKASGKSPTGLGGKLDWDFGNSKGPWSEKFDPGSWEGLGKGASQPGPYTGAGGDALRDLKTRMANGENLDTKNLVTAMPDYGSSMVMGPNGQLQLGNPYKLDVSGSAGYGGIRNLATSRGPSDMYRQQLGLINTQRNSAMDDLGRTSDQNYASGLSNLAQSGGLDQGATERLNRQKMLGLSSGQAGIYGQAGEAAGRAGVADAGMKVDAMGKLAGMDMDMNKYNAGAAMGDLQQGNLYNLESWGKLGDVYGSNVTAAAMAAAANKKDPGLLGGGGFMGTGLFTDKGMFGTGFGKNIGNATAWTYGGPTGGYAYDYASDRLGF